MGNWDVLAPGAFARHIPRTSRTICCRLSCFCWARSHCRNHWGSGLSWNLVCPAGKLHLLSPWVLLCDCVFPSSVSYFCFLNVHVAAIIHVQDAAGLPAAPPAAHSVLLCFSRSVGRCLDNITCDDRPAAPCLVCQLRARAGRAGLLLGVWEGLKKCSLFEWGKLTVFPSVTSMNCVTHSARGWAAPGGQLRNRTSVVLNDVSLVWVKGARGIHPTAWEVFGEIKAGMGRACWL